MTDSISAGCRALEVLDPVQRAAVPVHLLYPASAPARAEAFGPYSLEVARDAPPAGDRLPLVAVSHGDGGTPWTHRDLAASLARAGFAVALVEHPGNSRRDNALAGTAANLANRPRHLRLAIDAALADPAFGPALSGRAAALGHSIGGYTALALAGGRPSSLPEQNQDGVGRPVDVEPDPRVAAAVLLAPALPWLMAPAALNAVRVPLLVLTAERDHLMPPAAVDFVLRGLPAGTSVEHRVVAGAGHFSFQSPFPPALAGPAFAPSQDPPGFDRAAYQRELAADVIRFLRDSLA